MKIHHGISSWRFSDSGGDAGAARYSGATVGDLNLDGIQDIVIVDPLSYNLSGSLTLVYGGNWPEIDSADGDLDGQIDLHTCVQREFCTRLRSSETRHGFGFKRNAHRKFRRHRRRCVNDREFEWSVAKNRSRGDRRDLRLTV